ncbi:hypothetical protein [Actinacidiphila epipremni]|uniref:Uncharacterized protein n=1 Tax=Actinacidiphila epipremni TaxID=2053013 RepID=A0ABX0ZN65_9ACTN|nr:hypothetical protein [Actinacidiphila epipremni]NJP44477.1 hypothetical protein [Actinacidiphila epipremni]
MTELEFVGRTFVNFRDHVFPEDSTHGFRWVDLKSFRFRQGSPDGELLEAVIAHEQFRDEYAGGGVDPDGTRHGPYWLRSVSPTGTSQSVATGSRRRCGAGCVSTASFRTRCETDSIRPCSLW